MRKTYSPGKSRRKYEHQARLAWLIIGLTTVAGCNTPNANHAGDPLFGEYYPKGPNGQPMPPPNPPTHKTTSTGALPYPTTNAATSTAAIAGNTGLPGGKTLAINQPGGTAGTLTSTGAPGAPAAGNGVPVVQPIPRDTLGPVAAANAPKAPNNTPPANTVANPGATIIPTGSWSTTAQPLPKPNPVSADTNVDALQATLQSKGAIGLKQDNTPDGVRVSCYVPRQTNPPSLRYLETVAPDYAAGLQALLRQVDQ